MHSTSIHTPGVFGVGLGNAACSLGSSVGVVTFTGSNAGCLDVAPSIRRPCSYSRLHTAGVLQADAYAGFDRLYGEKIQEAACWAAGRTCGASSTTFTFSLASPIALEALERIGRLYQIESRSAADRLMSDARCVRHARVLSSSPGTSGCNAP